MKQNKDIRSAVLCHAPRPLSASSKLDVPFADGGVRAGFPSPAQDYMSESIDLNRLIVRHKESTFYARVAGESMRDAGIFDGDIVVIDKGLEARDGDYIVAYIDGEFTLKRYKLDARRHCAWLMPANDAFKPIQVTEANDFMIWGVVTYSIKKLSR